MTATRPVPTVGAPAFPTDFRLDEGLARPEIRRLRAVLKQVMRTDPVPDEAYLRGFAADMYVTDTTAEQYVDRVVFGPLGARRARNLLEEVIASPHGIAGFPEAPPAMRALLEEFEHVPDWVDRAMVEQGAAIWKRWGRALFNVAGAGTLEMYTESAVATPLSLAGGYAGDKALRRFLETTRFWMDVSEPGALFTKGSAGRATAMRVRVMHVSVRRRVAGHPEWDSERWGLPISQAYQFLTLMGGSVAPALAMWGLGYLTSPAEIRALMHFNRYLGYLLGVRPSSYPETVRDGVKATFAAVAARTYTSGQHGAELIGSFAPAFAPTSRRFSRTWWREYYEYRLMCGYVVVLLQPGTRRAHDVPSNWWALLPLGRAPFVAASELVRILVPGAAERQSERAAAAAEAWYASQMDGREAAFEAVSALRR